MEANARQRIGIFSSFVLMIGYDGEILGGRIYAYLLVHGILRACRPHVRRCIFDFYTQYFRNKDSASYEK